MREIAPSYQSSLVASREKPDPHPTERTVGLRELFEAHGAYVWKALRRLGVPHADLEDLAHDVFVAVQRHLGDYDPKRPVRPWLFGFAFRVASEHRRRAHRRYETLGENPEQAPDPAPPADEKIAREQDRRLVVRALEAVELPRRAVFVLYEIDGEPMSEIATSLGIPLGTAYSRLRLAREEFAAAVKRLQPDGRNGRTG